MANSLSNLVINLAERVHKIKCKDGHDNKTCKTSWLKYKDGKCCLEFINAKDELIECKCWCCN